METGCFWQWGRKQGSSEVLVLSSEIQMQADSQRLLLSHFPWMSCKATLQDLRLLNKTRRMHHPTLLSQREKKGD